MTDINQLWEKQLELYPNSRQWTVYEVLKWAGEPSKYNRYRSIAMTLQEPNGVWYSLTQDGPLAGYRYGLNGPDYTSGFSDI